MTQKELYSKVNDIHKLLVGNGGIGLCEEVRNNKTDIGYLKEKIKNIPKNWRSWIGFLVTVGTFLILILATLGKFI